jgi:hypothetical protein
LVKMTFPWIAPAADPAFAPLVARFHTALGELPPELAPLGRSIIERISSAGWHLEWNLPRWLAGSFHLSPNLVSELTLGNIFGLAYVRLRDDLSDGEAAPSPEGHGIYARPPAGVLREGETAPSGRGETAAGSQSSLLARGLYRHWTGQYRPLFDAGSPFWDALDFYVNEWMRSLQAEDEPPGASLRSASPEAMRILARRGAPLKICCVAAALLTKRQAHLPPLLEGIDHLLAGAVLVDHADDWQADLAAGRYNAFGAYFSRQDSQDPAARRQSILEELLLGDAGRSYFRLAQGQFRRSSAIIQGLGIPDLEAYLAWAEKETPKHGARLALRFRQRLKLAAADLLRQVKSTVS